jgi:hypothetical protein
MKKLLGIIIILTLFGCEKVGPGMYMFPKRQNEPKPSIIETNPTQPKVGFVIDSNWFKNTYKGYWIETHRWYGYGDFNKDGMRDLVVMFATNSLREMKHQKDTSSRIVVGVFINHKTYFELDTNLVYSYLGGYNGVNVADINNDGYLDIYQMTGYWETKAYPKPAYYNNSGWGGMDSYLFINKGNKGFTKYTIPVGDDSGSNTSVIYGNKIYMSNAIYYEFTGNKVNRNELVVNSYFNNIKYNIRVITPKFASEKGIYYLASIDFSNKFVILKVDNGNLIPIVTYDVPYKASGFTEGSGGERDEMYVQDLDKDGKLEFLIPSQIFSTATEPCTPYLMILDEMGNNVSSKYMDEEITKPLTLEQMSYVNRNGFTGFIYHTFYDMNGDGIKDIFPASGLGYKKGNDTYYYKFENGKYKLQLYHIGWTGDVNDSRNDNYWPFVDEKTGVNLFLTAEGSLYKTIFKTF